MAIAAILLQKQNSGSLVGYFSQATNEAENKYHFFELEMLAIVGSTEKFHIYLVGIEFKVIIDCNALADAVNKTNINSCVAC